jgi:hypothetical protein
MFINLDKDEVSDKDCSTARTVTQIVMAEQIIQDVVKEAQSMGDASPIDATATTTNNSAGDGEALSESMTAILKPSKVLLSSSLNNSSTSELEIGVTPSSTNKANEDVLTVSGCKDTQLLSGN